MSENTSSQERHSTKALFSGSAVVVAIKGLGLAAGFGIYFLLAKYLGPAEFGIYSYILSLGLIGATIVRLGMDAIIIRVVIEARAKERFGLAKGMMRWSIANTVLLSLVAASAFAYWAHTSNTPVLMMAVPVMIGVALINVATSILLGLERGPWIAWPEFMGRPVLVLAILGIAVLMALKMNAASALAVQAFISMALAMVVIIHVLRAMPDPITQAPADYAVKTWLLFAVPVLWNTIVLVSEPQLVIIIAGTFLPAEEVGPIALVTRMAALAGIAEIAVNFIVPPILARLYQSQNIPQMARTVRLTGRIMLLPTIPALFIVWAFGELILGYFGEAYLIAYWPLVIFTLARATTAIFGPVVPALLMSGHEKDVAFASTVSVIAMVIVALVLVEPLGPMGIAIAVFTSTVTRLILNWLSVRRRLGFNALIVYPLGPDTSPSQS
jgi:O-antigen/teichoic acid export membrane protein